MTWPTDQAPDSPLWNTHHTRHAKILVATPEEPDPPATTCTNCGRRIAWLPMTGVWVHHDGKNTIWTRCNKTLD